MVETISTFTNCTYFMLTHDDYDEKREERERFHSISVPSIQNIITH